MKRLHLPARGLPACAMLSATVWLTPHAFAQSADDGWRFSVGLGAVARPSYPGSSAVRLNAMPTFGASNGRLSIGPVPGLPQTVGANYTLIEDGPWRFGVGLGANLGKLRQDSDSPKARGLGDINGTILGSVHGSYNQRWFTASANVITDAGGQSQGTRLLLDMMFKANPVDRLMLSAGMGLTLADGTHAQTFYGVSATQSANSGLTAYSASGGLQALRMNLGAEYSLTREWSLGARVGIASLRGDAAHSPITEKTVQTNAGVFANYRF